ncbi:MAG: serine hydrolase [Deltaproteobacteria bacterium]|nr:serine hydrolase [Deltaproteobacteria bacterium]
MKNSENPMVKDDWFFPFENKDWEKADPKAVGFNSRGLEEALNYAGEHNTTGIVILYKGRVLAERYWDFKKIDPKENVLLKQSLAFYSNMQAGKTAQGYPLEDTASVQKSLIATLVYLARQKGYINFDDPVTQYLGPGWTNTPPEAEKKIKVKHLLNMTSGLTPTLQYSAEPGETWLYNTTTFQLLVYVVANAVKKDINEITREWISGPLNMEDTKWVIRKWMPPFKDRPVVGMITSNRDLARFGLFLLTGGSWAGQSIFMNLNDVREMFEPSQKMNPSYGILWWLNGQKYFLTPADPPVKIEQPLIPSAPLDLVAALGLFDRAVFIVPSHDLVVTRLGFMGNIDPTQMETHPFFDEFWKKLTPALPKKASGK